MARETLLTLSDVSVFYGGVRALHKVSLELDEGEIVALMGPNGAGKSTVLKAIFGLIPVFSGMILWHEREVRPVPHEMAAKGISFVPQGRRVFPTLTVFENLEIGGVMVKEKRELRRRMEEVLETFPVLRRKLKARAGALSGGEQQMLAVARGLMCDPKVLLLDEPSLGLAPKIVKEVFAKIREINERHKTAILVVEHNFRSLLEIADCGYVLDKGEIIAEGPAEQLAKSGILEKVFLGAGSDRA